MAGTPRALRSGPIRFFFTHAHQDHLIGFPFFLPAYLQDYNII